jgi:hypothetical protein
MIVKIHLARSKLLLYFPNITDKERYLSATHLKYHIIQIGILPNNRTLDKICGGTGVDDTCPACGGTGEI